MLMLERHRQGPSREAVEQAALGLLARHGSAVLATARRYAATPEDAEDAYQRSLEILLTKAPTTREEELLRWLRTVVKHEAFALRRQRDRLTPVSGDGEPVERGTHPTATHEQAERYERLRQSAEALRRLKPQEIRCLVLKARGLSYREICDATGFTYTKVNRCLTEGRQALAAQLAGIEGGIECDRLAPLVSALADGEATAEQLAVLRPHMKTCLACRARLREFRAAPARVAALMPVAVLATDGGHAGTGSALHAVLNAAHHKAAALAERAHTRRRAGDRPEGGGASGERGGAGGRRNGGRSAGEPPRAADRAPGGRRARRRDRGPARRNRALPLIAAFGERTAGDHGGARFVRVHSGRDPPAPPPDPANEFAPAPAPKAGPAPRRPPAPMPPPPPLPGARPRSAQSASSAGEFAP